MFQWKRTEVYGIRTSTWMYRYWVRNVSMRQIRTLSSLSSLLIDPCGRGSWRLLLLLLLGARAKLGFAPGWVSGSNKRTGSERVSRTPEMRLGSHRRCASAIEAICGPIRSAVYLRANALYMFWSLGHTVSKPDRLSHWGAGDEPGRLCGKIRHDGHL